MSDKCDDKCETTDNSATTETTLDNTRYTGTMMQVWNQTRARSTAPGEMGVHVNRKPNQEFFFVKNVIVN